MKSEKDISYNRVYRGGSVDIFVRPARAAYRDKYAPYLRVSFLGFRLVRTVKVDKQVERWREELEEELFSDE